MRHLELHLIQSVPVSCLNRDDLGSPKTAFFGGVKRARVSSQSWKRAIREYAREIAPEIFKGMRTKLIIEPLTEALEEKKVDKADAVAREIANELASLDDKASKAGKPQVKTLFFTSPQELEKIASEYSQTNDVKSAVKSTAKVINWLDAADIALFGRMVANDHSLTVEGAAMFSHALSTHKADSEMDFYTAVDDRQPDEEAGAGMMGTLEFQSATYYRFVAVNLDMLADGSHLGALTREQRQKVVEAFVEAVIKAIPSARKNSMNANTLPVCVLAIVREKGHPIQLVNAFETPVKGSGLALLSAQAMKKELASLKSRWGLESVAEYELSSDSPMTFAEFLAGVSEHVL